MQRWQVIHREGGVLLARPGRMRFDLCAGTELPPAHPLTVAHEIRKDLWRALQRLRGFSPVVAVMPVAGGLRVTAGGQMAAAWPGPQVTERIAALLADPGKRARWVAHGSIR